MNIFQKIKKLNLPKDKFTVFGGGVLEAYGVRKSGDVDLVVTQDVYHDLKKKGWREKIQPDGFRSLKKGSFEAAVDFNCGGYKATTEYLIQTSSSLNGILFASLDEIIKFKQSRNSKKDREDVVITLPIWLRESR